MSLQVNHILSVEQFSTSDLNSLFQTTQKVEDVANGKVSTKILQGAILANMFFEASTRTRMSFHSAFARLGGDVCDTTGFSFSSISKGESLSDTSQVISKYADVIVIRHPEKGSVAEFAKSSVAPVINGGDGPGEHPTQALLDIYTIFSEYKKINKTIDNSTVAMSGDLKHGRTVHSLAKLLCLYKGLTFKLVSPKSLEMPNEVIEKLKASGHKVEIYNDPYEGFKGADVIYTTRIQQERFSAEELEGNVGLYSVDKKLIESSTKEDAIVLHPLPRDTRPGAFDLTTDFDDDKRLKIFTQAANGIPVRMALFIHVLGLENEIGNDFVPSKWAGIKQ